MNRELFLKTRVLFVRSGCPHCALYLEFIERINTNLPLPKRIKVVDCAVFDAYGIITDPLIRAYKKHFDSYPTLFIGHEKRSGSHTKIELEAFLRSRLINDFIFPYPSSVMADGEEISLRHESECKFEKGWFRKKVICHG